MNAFLGGYLAVYGQPVDEATKSYVAIAIATLGVIGFLGVVSFVICEFLQDRKLEKDRLRLNAELALLKHGAEAQDRERQAHLRFKLYATQRLLHSLTREFNVAKLQGRADAEILERKAIEDFNRDFFDDAFYIVERFSGYNFVVDELADLVSRVNGGADIDEVAQLMYRLIKKVEQHGFGR